MGSPEKPIDVEMGDMDETNRLNPDVDVKGGEKDQKEYRFTGLKKEELLEVSSEKKWVVARWILFILFWIVWIAMLVGAIVIVIMAPRCKDEPSPPWYQDTTIYEADVVKFGGNIEGVQEHLDYVRFINAKTLVVVNAHDPNDLSEVVSSQKDQFMELSKSAAGSDKDQDSGVKLVVDLPIHSLSTSSMEFAASANKSCVGSPDVQYCSMFLWRDNGTADVSGTADASWKYHAERGQEYKASTDGSAYLNYAVSETKDYLVGVVKKWIGYGVDGFQLRDFGEVGLSKAERDSVVNALFAAFNETQSQVADEDKKVLGLFLSSSDPRKQSEFFPADKTLNSTAAVVINTGLYGLKTAAEIKDAIMKWRNATEPFTCSYALNTMTQPLLAEAFNKSLAAGYTLLSYALPGVPYVRSGDEALLMDDAIAWVKDEVLKIARPDNASTEAISSVKNIADLRVNRFRAMKSLRWDHNADSTFTFVQTNATDVVAFARKWDIKPVALTIFNPTDQVVIVKQMGEPKYEVLEVLAYSVAHEDSMKVDFAEGIAMQPGSTMIMSAK